MRNKYALAAAFCVVAIPSAWAADLMPLAEPNAVVDTTFVSSPIYVQLLGGATFGLDATFYLGGALDAVDPTRVGYAVAGTVGVTVYQGLSIEADVMHTFRNEVAAGLDTYATTSLMANLKYTLPVNDIFSVYAAAGLGYIWVDNYDGPPVDVDYSFGGFGYQLIGGASVAFTPNLTGLAEFRFQDSVKDYEIFGGAASLDLPTATVLTGLKLSF
jgi:opacity protein-like surface antigen